MRRNSPQIRRSPPEGSDSEGLAPWLVEQGVSGSSLSAASRGRILQESSAPLDHSPAHSACSGTASGFAGTDAGREVSTGGSLADRDRCNRSSLLSEATATGGPAHRHRDCVEGMGGIPGHCSGAIKVAVKVEDDSGPDRDKYMKERGEGEHHHFYLLEVDGLLSASAEKSPKASAEAE